MKTKGIKSLCELGDPAFFKAVSEGLGLILHHARHLFAAAEQIGDVDRPASEILAAVAEEEAAKFLILLDAVRCPRNPADRFVKQLGRFNDHLAKGLYVRGYEMAPGTLMDLQSYLEPYRVDFYLDGPNDIDWIFPNEIRHSRESRFYVDYVRTDDGPEWLDPRRYEGLFSLRVHEPRVLAVSKALSALGAAESTALHVVAQIWRSSPPTLETTWNEVQDLTELTFRTLTTHGLLKGEPDRMAYEWQFPMYDLDLSLAKVDQNKLRQRQESWAPD